MKYPIEGIIQAEAFPVAHSVRSTLGHECMSLQTLFRRKRLMCKRDIASAKKKGEVP